MGEGGSHGRVVLGLVSLEKKMNSIWSNQIRWIQIQRSQIIERGEKEKRVGWGAAGLGPRGGEGRWPAGRPGPRGGLVGPGWPKANKNLFSN